MSHPTRRAVARGAAWSIPAIAVASAAPAMAASPCSQIIKGQPLPASAFTAGYFIVTNQTFGILNDKVISAAAGIALTPLQLGVLVRPVSASHSTRRPAER